MRMFNLGRKPSPQPEGEDPETLLDEEGAGDQKPAGGSGQRPRLLLILLAVLVVAAGGYFAYDLFIARKSPAPPARPIRPIAKAPSPPVGPPPGAPATQPTPPTPAPPGAPSPPGGAAPAAPSKAAAPAAAAPVKTAVPSKAGPPGPVASLSPPTTPEAPAKALRPAPAAPAGPQPAKAHAEGDAHAPSAKTAGPSKIAQAGPAVPAAGPSSLGPPAAGPPKAAAPAAPGTFSLQVGAMANEANAQRLKQQLEQLGYSPVIRKGSAHIRRHVVTVGDFSDRAGAEDLAKRLTGHGINGRVDTASARFFVEAGSFISEDDAIDMARELQKLNYPPRIQDIAQNATLYQIRVGSFATRTEAQAKGAELKSKGFPYLVVKN